MKSFILFLVAGILITLRSSGQSLVWSKQMGGSGADAGYAITVDPSGNQYVTGYFSGTADFDPGPATNNLVSAGLEDIFVSKFTSSGNIVWTKQMGGSSHEAGYGIALDAAGNIYITGSFYGTADFDPGPGVYNLNSNGSSDIFICKLDPSGNFVYAKSFGGPNEEDHGYAIAVDAAGNACVTGSFKGTVDFDPGPGTLNLTADYIDIFVVKLDPSGNLAWGRKMGGLFRDIGYSITLDNSGNVYTTGMFMGYADFDPGPGVYNLNSNVIGDTDPTLGDLFLSKLDAAGNFVWAKQLSGYNEHSSYGNSLALDDAGNIYIAGTFNEWIDFDPGAGTNFIAAGGLNDGFVLKLNASGNFVWAKIIGGCQLDDHCNSLAVDGPGNVYILGVFFAGADFDPGPGSYNLSPVGGLDAYICKLNIAGNFVWANRLGGVSDDYGYALALGILGNVYTTGTFQGSADFDPGQGTFNLNSFGGTDIFVTRQGSLQEPLPVKFGNIKAWPENGGARIEWSNLTESQVNYYSVERAGSDQIFSSISRVLPVKNDGSRADYTFFDPSPLKDLDFYRIQSKEADGKLLYSVTVKVQMNINKPEFGIFPNPVTNGQLILQTSGLFKGEYKLSIFNSGGQEIYRQALNTNGGSLSEMIPLNNLLSKGTYYMKLAGDEIILTKQFIVK